ncbi:MAG: dihydrodipicolinate synthase family protein, partial [Clostridia bacterium]|nr:dihydrodipicolinate synthase family protein [Clostridia bacterium]
MIKTINNGVYPTMITPYTNDNKIDYNAVLGIMDWYAKKGVDGIFAVCQSSEMFFLSFEERLELLRFIIKNAPEGMSIVASGHTAGDIDRQIYEANAFINEGIDAYVFIANRFADENEGRDVFLKNYKKVVSSIPEIGLGVYECPYPYKRLMTADVLKECAQISPLLFIKDTCCSVRMIKEKLEAVRGTDLKLFNA